MNLGVAYILQKFVFDRTGEMYLLTFFVCLQKPLISAISWSSLEAPVAPALTTTMR